MLPRVLRSELQISLFLESVVLPRGEMVPQAPYVQRLNELDRSSPRFPDQLAALLDEKDCRDHVSGLPDHDAAWLVEYLDNVCALPSYVLILLSKTGEGSRYSCSRQPCFSGIPGCAQMDVRCSKDATHIIHPDRRSFDHWFPPGRFRSRRRCLPSVPQWLQGLRQAHPDIFRFFQRRLVGRSEGMSIP